MWTHSWTHSLWENSVPTLPLEQQKAKGAHLLTALQSPGLPGASVTSTELSLGMHTAMSNTTHCVPYPSAGHCRELSDQQPGAHTKANFQLWTCPLPAPPQTHPVEKGGGL